MAKITLKDLSHSYLKTQSSDVDWAVRNVNIDLHYAFNNLGKRLYQLWALRVAELR